MKNLKPFTLAWLVAGLLIAGEPKWVAKDYTQWTNADVQQILNDSPWAKPATAFFGTTDEDARTYPVQSPTARDTGMGGREVSDGHWDGGVGRMNRGGTPTLPVTVRWDSALPLRQALLNAHARESRDSEHTLADEERYYVLTVIGLAQGRAALRATDPDTVDSPAGQGRTPFDTTQTRQGLLNYSRLMPKGKKPIVPADVRVDEGTGLIQVYFPKSNPIVAADKEVLFQTTYGSIKVTQRFRLKDMNYKGKLEL